MSTGVVGPGEGRRRFTARGSVMLFKALAEHDGGDFSLMEHTLPPGGRRPSCKAPAKGQNRHRSLLADMEGGGSVHEAACRGATTGLRSEARG